MWQREYDERGNLTSVTDPAGAVSQFSYSRAGHPAAITDALGHIKRPEAGSERLGGNPEAPDKGTTEPHLRQ
ncbi:RHS repeat domain-containing protein [Streptomyces sp. Je 1-332]|uniref:RHS repeat domain-containing protein n=1 Tax=Streptomyces sp. Je 1-332 TaxID=3231270 RepID=UPI00345AEF05